MKILFAIYSIMGILSCGHNIHSVINYYSVFGYVSQWNTEYADVYAKIYTEIAYKYSIPLEYLVRQGAVETRFDFTRRGDGGISIGTHQIKYIYPCHIKLLKMCDNGRLGKWMASNEYDPCYLLTMPRWNIEVAALKLRGLYNKYNNWEAVLIAYGCGQNSSRMKQVLKNKNAAYEKTFVRQVLGMENIL